MARQIQRGGSFAPPLTDPLLDRYFELVEHPSVVQDPQVFEILQKLIVCVEKWWNLPESSELPVAHTHLGDTIRVNGKEQPAPALVPLSEALKTTLFDLIPWDYELQAYGVVLDRLPLGTVLVPILVPATSKDPDGVETDYEAKIVDPVAYEIRNMAFHLLWHVNELCLDREPITKDKL